MRIAAAPSWPIGQSARSLRGEQHVRTIRGLHSAVGRTLLWLRAGAVGGRQRLTSVEVGSLRLHARGGDGWQDWRRAVHRRRRRVRQRHLLNLEFGFMGRARATRGAWSFGTDIIYMGLGGSSDQPNADVDVDQWAVELNVGYQLAPIFMSLVGARLQPAQHLDRLSDHRAQSLRQGGLVGPDHRRNSHAADRRTLELPVPRRHRRLWCRFRSRVAGRAAVQLVSVTAYLADDGVPLRSASTTTTTASCTTWCRRGRNSASRSTSESDRGQRVRSAARTLPGRQIPVRRRTRASSPGPRRFAPAPCSRHNRQRRTP